MIKLIGENPDEFSTHSIRSVGWGASWAFAAEVPTELIQLYGDWRSDAYKKYLKFSLEDKISVANSMKTHILKIFKF
jgi:hypothetical protein